MKQNKKNQEQQNKALSSAIIGAEIEKLPMDKCRTILNSTGLNYTEEEMKSICDFLYLLAATAAQQMMQMPINESNKETIVIPLNNNQDDNEANSHYLCAG